MAAKASPFTSSHFLHLACSESVTCESAGSAKGSESLLASRPISTDTAGRCAFALGSATLLCRLSVTRRFARPLAVSSPSVPRTVSECRFLCPLAVLLSSSIGGTAPISASQLGFRKSTLLEASARCGAAVIQWLACRCSHELSCHSKLAGTPKASVAGLPAHIASTSLMSARLKLPGGPRSNCPSR